MKYLSSILLMLILISCSSRKSQKVDPDLYLFLNKKHSQKHALCIDQIKNVLNKAITETKDAELDDELYFFVRDEEKALEYIKSLDISKFTLHENQLEANAVISACVSEIDPSHKFCNSLSPAMKYFRGQIYALRQYSWSPATKKLAVEQILSYLEYVGRSKSSLMEIFYANDLLMRLASLGYVPKDIYNKSVAFKNESEAVQNELQKIIEKLSKKKLTCENAQEFYLVERQEVGKLSEKFLELMRKTN